MMKVNAVIVTGPQDFPFGTLGGAWRFTVTDQAGVIPPATQDSETTDATFQCGEGKYVLTLQRLDQKQTPIGESFSQPFEIVAPAMVTIDVVKGVNLTITAN